MKLAMREMKLGMWNETCYVKWNSNVRGFATMPCDVAIKKIT